MSKPIRIFLVEDNQADIVLVGEALRENEVPHELMIARDFAEALRLLELIGTSADAPRPDILLVDLNLPKGSGEEVLASFRKHSVCADRPAILMTSSSAPRDRQRAEDLGASFFCKPSDLTDFMKLGAIRDMTGG